MEGKEACRIVIVSGYRSCNQQTQLGSATYHNQQIQTLTEKGHPNPNPHHQFMEDWITQVRIWHHQKKAILICLDANENIINPNPNQGIGCLLAKTDLIDLHHHWYPHLRRPSTYNRGTLTIDICLGSPEFAAAMTAAMLLPFGIPIHLSGDHRALLMDFDSCVLFGHAPPPA